MLNVQSLTRKFEHVFSDSQANVLAEAITDAYSDLVKTGDFNELKDIVKNLGQAQERTEKRIEELTQAQQRTEVSLKELADRTEASIDKLTQVITGLAQEVGGLSRSVSYGVENEAYRRLPAVLADKYNITIQERDVRRVINGEEIDFFALGERAGQPICVVGESKLQLDEWRSSRREAEKVFEQLMRKMGAVQGKYPRHEIIPLTPHPLFQASNRCVF